eukprot:m.2353 g.2353  ORF g.2353 m.2353 type:complete len:351 (-) comp1679_c0_seq2:65-1117(-)
MEMATLLQDEQLDVFQDLHDLSPIRPVDTPASRTSQWSRQRHFHMPDFSPIREDDGETLAVQSGSVPSQLTPKAKRLPFADLKNTPTTTPQKYLKQSSVASGVSGLHAQATPINSKRSMASPFRYPPSSSASAHYHQRSPSTPSHQIRNYDPNHLHLPQQPYRAQHQNHDFGSKLATPNAHHPFLDSGMDHFPDLHSWLAEPAARADLSEADAAEEENQHEPSEVQDPHHDQQGLHNADAIARNIQNENTIGNPCICVESTDSPSKDEQENAAFNWSIEDRAIFVSQFLFPLVGICINSFSFQWRSMNKTRPRSTLIGTHQSEWMMKDYPFSLGGWWITLPFAQPCLCRI